VPERLDKVIVVWETPRPTAAPPALLTSWLHRKPHGELLNHSSCRNRLSEPCAYPAHACMRPTSGVSNMVELASRRSVLPHRRPNWRSQTVPTCIVTPESRQKALTSREG
jgi:hypothetical protein